MREITNESVVTFGGNFSKYAVPTFEVEGPPLSPRTIVFFQKTVEQLNSTFRKFELLSSNSEQTAASAEKSLEEIGDSLTCICIAGYLINMITDVNSFVHETHLSSRDTESKFPIDSTD